MIRSSHVLIACLGVSVLAIACSASPDDSKIKLADNTSIVPDDLAEVANVQDDRIVFPASAWDRVSQWTAGKIIVGDRASAGDGNPEGFLRRVASVARDGDTAVVMTLPATLQEAVDKLQFQTTLDTPQLGANGPTTQGLQTQGTGKTVSLIDFSGTKLIDENESVELDPQHTVGFRIFATATQGAVGFTPSWDVGADVGFLYVSSFHATATGELVAALELDAGVQLTSNLDADTFTKLLASSITKSQSKTLADYKIKLGKVKVGPLPIPISARFTTTLDCDFRWGGGAEVVVGGRAIASVTAGVRYENDTFTPVFDKSVELTQSGPSFKLDGMTKIQCNLRPKFELRLWGIASGEIWANGWVDVGGSLTCAGPDANGNQLGQVTGAAGAGASAGVKAKIDVLGLLKWQKQCTLFDVDTSADYTKTFTLPGGPSATCTGTGAYQRDPHQATPQSCFGADMQPSGGDGGTDGSIGTGGGDGGSNGACAHDECTVGDKLGAQCTACTQKVCAQDPYCCDTFWGPSCFSDVAALCGFQCP